MATLYELTNEYKMLLNMAEDPDIDMQALTDTFEALSGEIEMKAEGYAKVIRELEGRQAMYQIEAKRMADSAARVEESIKTMKERLKLAMKETGKTKFQQGLFRFSVVKNGGLAPLKIDGKVPEEFQKVETVVSTDNKKVREYLKTNTCDWAHLEDRGDRLDIK